MDKFLKPKTEGGELEKLRARVTDLEAQLTKVTAERDKLKAGEAQLAKVTAERDALKAVEAKLAKVTAERDALKAASASQPPAAAAAPAAAGGGGASSSSVATSSANATSASVPTAPGSTLSECGADAAFLTPRGRFKFRFCENAVVLVGKSSECVVPYASVARLWLLPEASSVGGQLLIVSLSQPAVNGKASVSILTIHSKPNDAPLQADLNGTALSGKPALLLRDAITHMRPEVKVTEPSNPNTGGFKPMHGAALQCYNKATECSVYLLDKELLVREGGKAIILAYSGLRAEVLPPSGRRTFDIQLECPPPPAATPAAGSGSPAAKPVKLELSLIPADEFAGVLALLKKKKVNVNGSRDALEGGEEGEEGEEAGGASQRRKKTSAAGGAKDGGDDEDEDDEEEESDDESDDDDDSDDEDDEDFKASDGSEPEEEYDSDGGEQVAMDDDDEHPRSDDDDEDDDEEEDEDDDDEEEEEAKEGEDAPEDALPAAKRAKLEKSPENVAPQAEA